MADNKLNEIISTALEKMQSISDGNTVIGKPIETPSGTTIIPVSKVSLGLVSGGVDYFGKNQANSQKPSSGNNFGGGGATGVSIVPVSFLIVSPDGNVDVVSASAPPAPADPVSRIADMVESAPDLIEKIKGLFPKKDKAEEKPADTGNAD